MSGHTPEPWAIGGRFATRVIDPSTKNVIADIWDINGLGQGKADTRRIVACVNACRGLSTETLETFGDTVPSGIAYHLEQANRERDEVLADGDRYKRERDEAVRLLKSAKLRLGKSEAPQWHREIDAFLAKAETTR